MPPTSIVTNLFFLTLVVSQQGETQTPKPRTSWIRVAPDGKNFVEIDTGAVFTPWGFNYDHDETGRLIEDYWDKDWAKIVRDFATMKKLGANAVRIHLQFGAFMDHPAKANPASIEQLKKLTKLTNENQLYLNLTGLACYHKKDIPEWYDRLGEKERWQSQAVFWKAVASAIKDEPSVFCLDLMNEPVVPGGKRKDGDWLGPPFAGKHFVQFIVLDQANRPRHEIARAWIDYLTGEIRTVDSRHLLTVGLVDWSLDRPGLTSGFIPEKTCKSLDFLCTHIYPEKGQIPRSLATLKGFEIGKPIILEETFPLKCDSKELGTFLQTARPPLNGVFSFYWGKSPEELKKSKTIGDAILAQWLEEFAKAKP